MELFLQATGTIRMLDHEDFEEDPSRPDSIDDASISLDLTYISSNHQRVDLHQATSRRSHAPERSGNHSSTENVASGHSRSFRVDSLINEIV